MTTTSEEKQITPAPEKTPVVLGSHGLVLHDLDQMWRFATLVARSGLAPKGMESPEAITIAVICGQELGISPFQSVQCIAVINGRPTVWGDTALALCWSSGLMGNIEEKLEGQGDAMTAVCRVVRKGQSVAIIRKFSMADAKRAGLLGKAGPWTQYTSRMLQLRARGFALRDAFPDVLKGTYLREEMVGKRGGDFIDVTNFESSVAQATEPEAEPEQKPEPVSVAAEPEPEPEANPITGEIEVEEGEQEEDLLTPPESAHKASRR